MSQKHKIKRAFEKAGFRVCLPLDEGQTFPLSARDMDGNKIERNDPRWDQIKKIHQSHG